MIMVGIPPARSLHLSKLVVHSVIQGVVNHIVANGIHVVTDSEGLVIENLDAQQ